MNQTEQQQDIHMIPPGEHQAIPTKNIRATRTTLAVKRAATLLTPGLLADYNIHRKGVIITNLTSAALFILLSSEDSVMPVANVGGVASQVLTTFQSWFVPADYCGRIWGILGAGSGATESVTVTELF